MFSVTVIPKRGVACFLDQIKYSTIFFFLAWQSDKIIWYVSNLVLWTVGAVNSTVTSEGR